MKVGTQCIEIARADNLGPLMYSLIEQLRAVSG